MVRKREEDKILDVNAAMKGSLVFSDPVNLRINGRFEGNLKTRGTLTIGEAAEVIADIEGENIVVSGSVKGEIKATEHLILTSTARIKGNIITPKLSMEAGAIFNGKCRMGRDKLNLTELSQYLSIEESKILEWVNSGKIPAEKEDDNLVFDREEVEAWIGQGR